MITCHFENGDEGDLRHVTVNTIIQKDGQILLGKRGTFKGKEILESGKWGLIGGFFDRDETLVDAAKREAVEETGWKIDNLKLFQIDDSPKRSKEDRQNVDFLFIADAVSRTPTDNEEIKELKWFPIDNLPSEKEMAFDFGEYLETYKKYLNEEFMLPIIGSIVYNRTSV